MCTFWKMHGAGNDFILMDDRDGRFPADDANLIRGLCNRHTGIGSDGLLLIRQPDSTDADIAMRFFNPDGHEADMCGNAARCLARLAADKGIAPTPLTIGTRAGPVRATVHTDGTVTLTLPVPDPPRPCTVTLDDGRRLACMHVNTGVPHAVLVVDALAATPVASLGAAIRYHPAFAPAGTNVDFITVVGPRSLAIRTYERGVEAETAACGTGVIAAALAAAATDRVTPPVRVTTAGGDALTVDFEGSATAAATATLTGPAAYAYEGRLIAESEIALRLQAAAI